jgi:CubicO group peptidase (beta-lactamase class C family)
MIRRVASVLSLTLVVSCVSRADELPRGKPESVGLSAHKLDEIKPGLQKLVDDGKIAGAVAVVARHGKVAFAATVGSRDLASKAPMTEDAIFAIMSMTKPITCVAAMMLVEEGKLSLDDPVEKYLAEFKNLRVLGNAKDDTEDALATVPAQRTVLVRHLFAHTSGLSYGFAMTGSETERRITRAYSKANLMGRGLKTIAELPGELAKLPLAHEPGEGWTYGMSHDVLGRVIEVVSGQPLDKFLNERVFVPLDMTDTSFLVPEAKRDRMATTYRAATGAEGPLAPLPRTFGSATYFSGGGGLFSTARDYSRFAQMLLNGGKLEDKRLIKPETLALMTSNQIGDHTAFGMLKYGLGFGLVNLPAAGGGKPVLDSYFWAGAYSTNFWVDPKRDVIGVVMTQVVPITQAADQLVHQTVNKAVEP